MFAEERSTEVEELLARMQGWAAGRRDVKAVALVGSWARGDTRMDSDVDLVVLTTGEASYLEGEGWVSELGGS